MSDLAKGCHRAHPHDEPCGNQTKWVVSKYAPETGERFESFKETTYFYYCYNDYDSSLILPKSEYIPYPPPERWERVPMTGFQETDDSINFCEVTGTLHCVDNERFRIIDGALVLERRVK